MNRRSQILHRRAAACLLAFVWLLVPVLGTVHSEGHSHRFCAEHRAFEEAPRVASSSGAASTVQAPVASTASVEAATARVATATHLLCPVAHPAQRDVTHSVSTGVAVELTVARILTVPASQSSHAPVAVLSLAPKLSPPEA